MFNLTHASGEPMSFLRKLFGFGSFGFGSRSEASRKLESEPVAYKGFAIRAAPYTSEGDQYQVAGVIEKEIDGVRKEHRFIRADRHASYDDAAEVAVAKGRLIIDEQGERMFS